ncbi:hypothetical protein K439DRAFT_1624372 [Ramaria rubella]|nr:hypothetical protein K439DRAFT_1624372 [Ramaria rubella]
MSQLCATKRETDRPIPRSTCATLATSSQPKPNLTMRVGPSRDRIQTATAEESHAAIEELLEGSLFKMLFHASGDDAVDYWVTALLVIIKSGGLMELFKLFLTWRSAIVIAWHLFEPLWEEICQWDPNGASPLNTCSTCAHGTLLQEEALDIERIQNRIVDELVEWRDQRRGDHMQGRGLDRMSD